MDCMEPQRDPNYGVSLVFEGDGGKRVQGVIKHHNSVSLPRVKKDRAKEQEEGVGVMKGSNTPA